MILTSENAEKFLDVCKNQKWKLLLGEFDEPDLLELKVNNKTLTVQYNNGTCHYQVQCDGDGDWIYFRFNVSSQKHFNLYTFFRDKFAELTKEDDEEQEESFVTFLDEARQESFC